MLITMDLGSWMSWFIEMVKNKQNSKKWITRFFIKIKYFRLKFLLWFNPLTPMSDQDRISPYNINTISSDENKEKYQSGDCKLIQYQILQINITRTVWQTVGRITNEILGVKGLIYIYLCFFIVLGSCEHNIEHCMWSAALCVHVGSSNSSGLVSFNH